MEHRVLLVLDNFRVGGLERLALDQLYVLNDLGIPAEAHYRQVKVTISLPNFLTLEESRIRKNGIRIIGLPDSDWGQLLHFFNLFRKNNFSLIINHSVGSAVILRLAMLISRKQIKLKTFVHQLPTLSAPIQRLKRFTYALFSNEIYGYSVAVTRDWNDRIDRKWLPKSLKLRLQMRTQRNGVYLHRLPTKCKSSSDSEFTRRVLFIGRNVGWKNLEMVFSLLRSKDLADIQAMIVVPMISQEVKEAAELEFGSRVKFEIGKKIEDVEFREGDINIYPVDYGPSAKFVESISLNCLEMACLGIPSIIAKSGSHTWPDLVELGCFYEVNWNNEEEILLAVEALAKRVFSGDFDLQARRLISIENNIKEILAD